MEQLGAEEYWNLFNNKVKSLTEQQQRTIAHEFCLLTDKYQDDLGKDALQLIEKLIAGENTPPECESCLIQLREKLPEEGVSIYSPLIWTLMPNTLAYPTWYAAAIAGLNIADLRMATLPELTALTRKMLDRF